MRLASFLISNYQHTLRVSKITTFTGKEEIRRIINYLGLNEAYRLTAERAAVVRVAFVDVFAGFKHLVAGAMPTVSRPAFVRRQARARKPHAELPDTRRRMRAEAVIGEVYFRVREAALGRTFARAIIFGVDGESATGNQVIADGDVGRAFQTVPDRHRAIGIGRHLVGVVADNAVFGPFGLVTVFMAVSCLGGKSVEIAVFDGKVIACA